MINEKNRIDGHAYNCRTYKKNISCMAIIAGALVGLGVSFLLYLFGAAIGLTAFKATETGVNTLALGGFLGSVICAVVSMYIGGWVSGYLARKRNGYTEYAEDHNRKNCGNIGILYGFITWVLALIVTILLAADVSTYISSRYYMASDPTMGIISKTRKSEAPMVNEKVYEKRTNSDANAPTRTTINEDKANDAGKTLFALFVMFFLGALASCVGGYMGIKFRCNHDADDKRLTTNPDNNPRI